MVALGDAAWLCGQTEQACAVEMGCGASSPADVEPAAKGMLLQADMDNQRDTPKGEPNLDERLQVREQFRQQHVERADLPESLTKYDVIGLIGEGATARVYLCEPHGRAGELYAMKVICKADVAARGKKDDVERERKLLQLAAGHPFVLNPHAFFESDNFEFLVLDHCPGSDLFEVQGTFPNQRMPEDAARFYFTEVMLGCECIHDLGFVIRDLKPENVLIDHQGHCRVSDFDLAIEKDRPRRREALVGTAEYISPEILKSVEAKTPEGEPGPDVETCDSSTVTEAADVWVLGLMLFEMLHGYAPFSKRANETLASCRERIMDADNPAGWITSLGKVKSKRTKSKAKVKRTKSMTQMIKISAGAKEMIATCLAADHEKRPRVIALRERKWLKGTKWPEVMARALKPPWVPASLTQSVTDLLRASSKAEQTRRGSIDRPGWGGHSLLAEQERESSRLSEQSSSSEARPEPTPPRGPSRISGEVFEAKSEVEGIDASHEMMIAMYALNAAKVEDTASVGTVPAAGTGRFMGTSYKDRAGSCSLSDSPPGATADEAELVDTRSDSSVTAARPRGASEPTTTLPPTTSPPDGATAETPRSAESAESPEALRSFEDVEAGSPVPRRRNPTDAYTNLVELAGSTDWKAKTVPDTADGQAEPALDAADGP